MRVTYDPEAVLRAARSVGGLLAAFRRATSALEDLIAHGREAIRDVEHAASGVDGIADAAAARSEGTNDIDRARAVKLLRKNGIVVEGANEGR